MDNKNSMNNHYAMTLILKMRTSGGGGLKIQTHADKGGGGREGKKGAKIC